MVLLHPFVEGELHLSRIPAEVKAFLTYLSAAYEGARLLTRETSLLELSRILH